MCNYFKLLPILYTGPGQVKLIPWKSTNDNEYNITIPVCATLVSAITMIAIIPGSIWLIKDFLDSEFDWKITISLFNISISEIMPQILGMKMYVLTYKKVK